MIKINRFFKNKEIKSMKKIRTLLPVMAFVVFMTFGVSFISTPGFAAECQIPAQPVADVILDPGGIIFVPRVNYALLEVTISRPDGTIYNEGFKSGNEPYVDLSKILGEGRFDCSYVYELRVVPDLKWKKREGDEVEIRYSERPLVQNGSFTVYRGEIVLPGEEEKGEGKSVFTSNAQHNLSGVQDFVINDDLIVDGSACIGFDCVNGESFGFDTLRLKENNLRIKFDDTSVAASFPRNDWQLTANDSANGGASKFSIDDISGNRTPFTVEANARSHSLYVDDGGRIGIRTSTPSTEIHVIDGDTPTLRLQQDGSSGFAPQTWDVAGNETNFFIRDVTNGSQLPFRVRPDAPTNSIFIDVDGDVGMGTSSPNAPLHVKEAAGAAATVMELENNGPTKFRLNNTAADYWDFNASANGLRMNANGSGTVAFRLDTNGDVTIAGTLTTAGNVYPDYVFEPGYNLLPMEELARHIEEKGHLPNIPSAEEMKKNGINMSNLQMRLLEKVEELTLYTLSQEETIRVQQEVINEQKKAMNGQMETIKKFEARLQALENKNQ